MAITINFAGASITKPGSYSSVTAAEATAATPAVGVVALIGESDAGPAFSQEKGLSAVTFGPDELSLIKEKYGSGPLVDAARLAISPSNDPQIGGGAQELLLLKTNQSTRASLDIKAAGSVQYGTLTDKKGGKSGNAISYECTSADGKVTITLSDLNKNLKEVSGPIGGTSVMTVQCTDGSASSATVTITSTHLTTSVPGASTAQALSVDLSSFSSVAKLCEYINTQPGYSASPASSVQGNKPVAVLDRVSAVSITSAESINQDAYEVRDFFERSSLVSFSQDRFVGLPAVAAKTYLSGGTTGGTTGANILDCFDALHKRRVNFIVPLFSRDADEDKLENLTDGSSNYTIDSVHAMASSHVAAASTVKGRNERQAWVGYKGSFDDAVEKAANLNSSRVSMCVQDIDALGADGAVKSMQPHMLAVVSAGMHASAAIGLSTTFKAPQINGFDHEDFDPATEAEKAIRANLTVVERSPNGGFRFALDNNTYAADKDAWIYNRPSVVFAGDFAAYSIRLATELFVGQTNSSVSAETVKNLLISVFDNLRSLGVIVPDTKTQGRGYKDLIVKVQGSIVNVDVTLSLVENIEFVLNDIKVQRAG